MSFEWDRLPDGMWSGAPGDPWLRARFGAGAGSAAAGPGGAKAASWRGEAMRSTEGARVVVAGGAAMAVDMAERASQPPALVGGDGLGGRRRRGRCRWSAERVPQSRGRGDGRV